MFAGGHVMGLLMNMWLGVVLFSLTLSLAAQAEETDFVQDRPTADQSAFLNWKMNQALQQISNESKDCHPQSLHRSILRKLGGWGWSEIESWVSEVPSSTRITRFQKSIYKDFPGRIWGCCSESINYEGTILSGDKLGHFLHSGYEMWNFSEGVLGFGHPDKRGWFSRFFDRFASKTTSSFEKLKSKVLLFQRNGNPQLTAVEWAIELSVAQEEGWWGLIGTGVKSYADMAANIEGFYFWAQLTQGPTPYFQCQNGKWNQVKDFTWSKYVHAGWDEGANCSEYLNPKNTDFMVAKKMCPVDLKGCQEIRQRFGAYPKLISPACR